MQVLDRDFSPYLNSSLTNQGKRICTTTRGKYREVLKTSCRGDSWGRNCTLVTHTAHTHPTSSFLCPHQAFPAAGQWYPLLTPMKGGSGTSSTSTSPAQVLTGRSPSQASSRRPALSPLCGKILPFTHTSESYGSLCGLKALPLNLLMEQLKMFSQNSSLRQLSMAFLKAEDLAACCVFCLSSTERWS